MVAGSLTPRRLATRISTLSGAVLVRAWLGAHIDVRSTFLQDKVTGEGGRVPHGSPWNTGQLDFLGDD